MPQNKGLAVPPHANAPSQEPRDASKGALHRPITAEAESGTNHPGREAPRAEDATNPADAHHLKGFDLVRQSAGRVHAKVAFVNGKKDSAQGGPERPEDGVPQVPVSSTMVAEGTMMTKVAKDLPNVAPAAAPTHRSLVRAQAWLEDRAPSPREGSTKEAYTTSGEL